MATGGDARRGLRGRLEAWRSRSIVNRITAAALTLTLTVALVIGGATFVAMQFLVQRNISAALESQARLAELKLVSDLDLTARDLADLAQNSFVANGLVDSMGRDTYLLPFLREHRSPVAVRPVLVLCDFKGKPVALNDPSQPGLGDGVRGVKAVLASARPHAEVVEEGGRAHLVLSHPVIFPPTGQVEGVLVERLGLAGLLAGATGFLGSDYEARLVIDGLVVGEGSPGRAAAVVVRFPVLPEALAKLRVALEVGTRAEVFAPLRWMAIVYALTGAVTVLLVFKLSRVTARRLAGPIEALSRSASRIAAGGELEMGGPVGGTDEVGTLSLAFADMLGKLRASQEELEGRVRERTSALQQREQELERYAETQAVLLREVNHRVKNNLAAIIGVVHLEESRAAARTEPAVRGILSELESRIRSLATVHALLSGVEWRPLPLSDLCLRLLRSSLGEAGGAAPALHVDPSPVRVESGQAHNLALVLNELATNTLKYGRSAAGGCEVSVGIETDGPEVLLTYRDHGPGFPPPVLAFAPEAMGTGLQLLRGIVETSLGGSLSLSNADGAVAAVRFRSAPARAIGATA